MRNNTKVLVLTVFISICLVCVMKPAFASEPITGDVIAPNPNVLRESNQISTTASAMASLPSFQPDSPSVEAFQRLKVGPPRCGSPSAIVYIHGNSVIAKDDSGKKISEGRVGKDDSEVIQDAIDYVPQGIVFVKPGTYIITSTIDLKSQVTLMGAGHVDHTRTSGLTIFQLGRDVDFIHAVGVYFLVDMIRVEICGIKFLNPEGYAGKGVHIRYGAFPKIIDCGFREIKEAIKFETVSFGRIDRCSFHSCGDATPTNQHATISLTSATGDREHRCDGIVISNSHFLQDEYRSIDSSTIGTTLVKIYANYFEIFDLTKTDTFIYGSFPNGVIYANNFQQWRTEEPWVTALYVGGWRLNVFQNHIGPADIGIVAYDRYPIISGNTISRCKSWGIIRNRNTYPALIGNNQIWLCGEAPWTGGISSVGNAHITGNRIFDCNGTGIRLYNATYGVVQDNYISNEDTSDTVYGIREIGSCDYNVIKNNVIKGETTTAVVTLGVGTIVKSNEILSP